jgi:predicted patatin/cPLA2 family phospholipase
VNEMPRKVEGWQIRAEVEARRNDPFLRRLARRFAHGAREHRNTEATPRASALPESMIETAVIPGYERARAWGDIYTPTFEELLIKKNQQVLAAAEAGIAPRGRVEANFLAISGGGDKGAFAAGVLTGWGERGDRPCFETVTGVSAGALAAPFAFINRDMCLEQIYTEYGAGHLYKSRGVRGFFSDALNDTTRLDKLIRHYVTDVFLDQIAEEHLKGRRLLVLTTNLDAQRQVIWSMSQIAASNRPDRRDLFVKVLRASSALPGLFPPVHIDVVGPDGRHYDEMHVDGGVTAELVFIPPETEVLKIEDMVFKTRRQRTLYVIQNGKLGPEYNAIDAKLLPIATRAVQTLVKYQVIDNLLTLAMTAKRNHSRFLFNAIPPSFTARPRRLFDRAHARELFEVGREVGRSGCWYSSPPQSPTLLPMGKFDLANDIAVPIGGDDVGIRSPVATGLADATG